MRARAARPTRAHGRTESRKPGRAAYLDPPRRGGPYGQRGWVGRHDWRGYLPPRRAPALDVPLRGRRGTSDC